MTTFTFAPATREQAKARIGIQGPAGSGKTKSALRIAEGLAKGGRIGVIDTERESALTYAPVPGRPELGGHEFGHMPMTVCSPENLIAAVGAAREAGIDVLVIDSWSHFWAGKGGLLERVDQESRKPGHYGGSYTAWGSVNPLEQDMLDALMGYPGHVIVTMRTKNDYEMSGKTVTKVGVKTIQREGAEYEVGLVIDMVQGTGTVTKTRYEPLEGLTVHHPGEELAETILEQLGQGIDPLEALLDELWADSLTYDAALALYHRADQRGMLSRRVVDRRAEGSEPVALGALIRDVGTALKAAASPAPPAPQVAAQPQPVPQQPEQPSAPAAAASATAPQMRKMAVLFNQLGLRERKEALDYTAGVIGRTIASRNELTKAEAIQLIDHLEKGVAAEQRAADEAAAEYAGNPAA